MIAGAAGFPSKQTSADSARRAIREVHKGNTFFSPSIPSRLDKRRQEGTQKVPQVVQEKQPIMNSELLNQALEKVGNPDFLVNLISRRVRQLNASSGGSQPSPLVLGTENQGAADIALREIGEGKMGWEIAGTSRTYSAGGQKAQGPVIASACCEKPSPLRVTAHPLIYMVPMEGSNPHVCEDARF